MKTAHKGVARITTPLVRVLRWAVFAILFYLVAAVNVTVLLRAGFGLSLPWIMDSAQLLAPWLALFAAATVFAGESHPRMEFLLNKFPPHVNHQVRIFLHALTLLLMGTLCFYSGSYAWMGKSITITSMDFLTLFPFYLSLPIGFACISLISLERLLATLARIEQAET